ncbi:hypothetical protein GGR32_002249 [Mesonia hippocampi]|uniref:Uncharacterized protein n=1 Tax=Mesonia hippocampi TaxID=1628250 RepID=A0A840EYP8_9FLAO|nr:hypothetical protein [Mesonia hippocampi]MBB4119937.1 hypothetical protein [Mesonia hippocampi]
MKQSPLAPEIGSIKKRKISGKTDRKPNLKANKKNTTKPTKVPKQTPLKIHLNPSDWGLNEKERRALLAKGLQRV